MEKADVQAVLKLWDESCLEATGEPLGVVDRDRVLQVLAQYPLHVAASAFVAVVDAQVVGFTMGFVTRHPIMEGVVGHVEELFVRSEWRRRGLGSDLVQRLMADLQQRGAWTLRTAVGMEDEVALKFWKSQGWSLDLVNFAVFVGEAQAANGAV